MILFVDKLGKCPAGWEERPGTDDCYIITAKKTKSWMEARQDCLNNQGDLVKIDSVAEKVFTDTGFCPFGIFEFLLKL